MNVEVRATGLRAMREKKGLTQRELAHNLGISQNYIPALESGARRPGPKLRRRIPGARAPSRPTAGQPGLAWAAPG